ncbi:MAG: hypothetical protein MUF16_19405, partial [Burkholderiaceae bacterium]|nr:hypothetical protein [Burkholderiaceae bacterium]
MLLLGGAEVRNEGLIDAVDGQVMLAAGRSIELADSGTPNIALRVSAPAGQALNLGTLSAGRVDLQAAMVNQQGLVRAQGLGSEGGRIVLQAGERLELGAGSLTQAGADRGGRIELLGRQVGVLDGATVSASAPRGGGEIFVGGGLQGRDATLPNAEAVYIGPAARLEADASAQGDGGRIIVWSDRATRAYGSFSARGGPLGGDGGFVETSGGWLDARPASIDTTAPRGRAGEWLLDPNDIFIVQSGTDNNITGGIPDFDFTTTDDSAIITTGTIETALNAGNNVTVTTGNSGGNSQSGDITMVAATISVTVSNDGSPVALTLNAARDIRLFSSTIESSGSGAPLNLALNAASGSDAIGTILVDNSSIVSNGGNIFLGGPSKSVVGPNATSTPLDAAVGYSGNGVGVSLARSRIDAGSGNLSIVGASIAESGVSGLAHGVSIGSGAVLSGFDIGIVGWVDSNGDLSRVGVSVESGARVTAQHTLSLDGYASSNVGVSQLRPYDGVRISGELLVQPVVEAGDELLSISGGLNTNLPAQPDSWGVNLRADLNASNVSSVFIGGTPSVQIGGQSFVSFRTPTAGSTVVQANGRGASVALQSVDFVGPTLDSGVRVHANGADASITFSSSYFNDVSQLIALAEGSGSTITMNYLSVGGDTGLVQLSADTVKGGGRLDLVT